MRWNNIPLIPMANTPETFGKALSYEGQLHAICERFDVITSGYNDTIDYINENFPWTFADPIDWTDEREYPAFQVVYDEDTFSSYVSLQQVPVGTPLTDTEYWARTAGYNGQVQGIADQLSGIQGDIDDVASDVSTLQGDVSSLQDGLSAAVNRTPYYGCKILCVTDSWGNEGVHNVTTAWMHLVCQWLGAEFIDLHRGTTGFIRGSDQGLSFQQRLETWVSENPDTVADVAYVFVCGTINDYQSTHVEISTAISAFINSARTNLPNATIVLFGMPIATNPYRFTQNAAYNSWLRCAYATDYFSSINPGRPRTVYVPATFYSLVADDPDTLMDDRIHPNQNGHNRIARFAYQALTVPLSKQIVRQQPVIKITEDHATYSDLRNLSTFSNLTIDDNVLNGVTEFRFLFPEGYTASSSSRLDLAVPYILPVSELASATFGNLGNATLCDSNGNVITGYLYERVAPYSIPDNSSDNSYLWITFVNNRSLGNLSGTVTMTVDWHINLTITNGVYV